MGKYKDKNGTTRVGDFLRKLGGIAKPILETAGGLTGQDWLKSIGQSIHSSTDLKNEQKQEALRLLSLDYEDLQNARSFQKAALKHEDKFINRFIYFFAIAVAILTIVYIFCITFCTIPEQNQRYADTILGFLVGGAFISIIQFFFGSSKGSHDKNKFFS